MTIGLELGDQKEPDRSVKTVADEISAAVTPSRQLSDDRPLHAMALSWWWKTRCSGPRWEKGRYSAAKCRTVSLRNEGQA